MKKMDPMLKWVMENSTKLHGAKKLKITHLKTRDIETLKIKREKPTESETQIGKF